jgi:hypothetical protein
MSSLSGWCARILHETCKALFRKNVPPMSHRQVKYQFELRFALKKDNFWSGFFFFGYSAYFKAVKRIIETTEYDALQEDVNALQNDSRKVVDRLLSSSSSKGLIDVC